MGKLFRLDGFSGDPSILKQTILLQVALGEVGLEHSDFDIGINHDKGFSTINGEKVGIIYPEHFFSVAQKHYHDRPKTTQFYFNGSVGSNGEREKLLEPYLCRADSEIIFSQDGRDIKKKGKVNRSYFFGMAKAHFRLCPHQTNWPGDMDSLWTYRFIECLMLKITPVLIRATPLSSQFTDGFKFIFDDEIKSSLDNHKLSNSELEKNFSLACHRFTLARNFVEAIK